MEKDVRIIQNVYWEQTAFRGIENGLSSYTKIARGLRQGYIFSPDLFNLYGDDNWMPCQDLISKS